MEVGVGRVRRIRVEPDDSSRVAVVAAPTGSESSHEEGGIHDWSRWFGRSREGRRAAAAVDGYLKGNPGTTMV